MSNSLGKKVDAVFDSGIFVSRKNYMLKLRGEEHYLWKAKGMNWKGDSKQTSRLYNILRQRVQQAMEVLADSSPQGPKFPLLLTLTCTRWIWNWNKTAVVVQAY